jgi:hypothetical protein
LYESPHGWHTAWQTTVPGRRRTNDVFQEESQLTSGNTDKASVQYAMWSLGGNRRFAKSASGIDVSMKLIHTENKKRMFEGRERQCRRRICKPVAERCERVIAVDAMLIAEDFKGIQHFGKYKTLTPLHDRLNGEGVSMDLINLLERDGDKRNLHPIRNGSAV